MKPSFFSSPCEIQQCPLLDPMAQPPPRSLLPHVIIFPFMAQGHTIPLLDLSKALSSKGLRVTILTTPANSPFILQTISTHPNILLHELDFPLVDGLPKGCENTDRLPSMDLYIPFLRATKQLCRPFDRFLRHLSDLGDLPICVISDFFLGWTLSVCCEFNLPRLVFHGMGAFSMAVSKSVCMSTPHKKLVSERKPFTVPRLPERVKLTESDLPAEVRDFDPVSDPFSRFIVEIGESDIESWGVVVNTFVELERDFIPPFESFYRNEAKAWCLGPMLLYSDGADDENSDACMEWLNERGTGTVIYASFGTQTHVSDAQMEEIAMGLEMSGCSFIWVVRSRTWSPPKEMEERIKGRGLMVKEWAPRRRILAHPAVGGFMSHCGWNSVLESLSNGVPILGWPMIAEQGLNAKLVAEEFGAGLRMDNNSRLITRWATICEGVKELMGGESGRRARERAQELSRVARQATRNGGSSDRSLDELIKQLTSRAKQIRLASN